MNQRESESRVEWIKQRMNVRERWIVNRHNDSFLCRGIVQPNATKALRPQRDSGVNILTDALLCLSHYQISSQLASPVMTSSPSNFIEPFDLKEDEIPQRPAYLLDSIDTTPRRESCREGHLSQRPLGPESAYRLSLSTAYSVLPPISIGESKDGGVIHLSAMPRASSPSPRLLARSSICLGILISLARPS